MMWCKRRLKHTRRHLRPYPNKYSVSTKTLLLALLLLYPAVLLSCSSEKDDSSFQVSCNSIVAQDEIEDDPQIVRYIYDLSFFDDLTIKILLKESGRYSGISTQYNIYHWGIDEQLFTSHGRRSIKFPLPCDCEAIVIDESPDEEWQYIRATITKEDGDASYGFWLISQNEHVQIFNARDWEWSSDSSTFSYMVPGHSYGGFLELIDLNTLDVAWNSYEGSAEIGDVPVDFLEPTAYEYSIAFSPLNKTYWYRTWLPEDQDKIYVYDPINKTGKIEYIENIRSAIWSDSLNQLLFVKSDDNYITIFSEDEKISAKIPYELYLDIVGEDFESVLTFIQFQISSNGRYVIIPKGNRFSVLACDNG